MFERYGYIYFIAAMVDDEIDAIKIGFSNDPHRRRNELATGSSATLTLVACMPGTQQDEQALHIELAPYRRSGEWFEPSPEVRRLAGSAQRLSRIVPSWSGCDPFPRTVREAQSSAAFVDVFGVENYELAKRLVRSFGDDTDADLAFLLAQLQAEDHWIDPTSTAIGYGLRAAAKRGVCRASYVLGCARKGIEESRQVPA